MLDYQRVLGLKSKKWDHDDSNEKVIRDTTSIEDDLMNSGIDKSIKNIKFNQW